MNYGATPTFSQQYMGSRRQGIRDGKENPQDGSKGGSWKDGVPGTEGKQNGRSQERLFQKYNISRISDIAVHLEK